MLRCFLFFLLHVGLFSPLFMDFCNKKKTKQKKQWVSASYRCYIGASNYLGLVWAWSHGHLGLVLVHFVLLKIWHFQNYSTYILKKTIQQAKKAKDDVPLSPMATDCFQSRAIVGQTQWAGMHSPAYGGKTAAFKYQLASSRKWHFKLSDRDHL